MIVDNHDSIDESDQAINNINGHGGNNFFNFISSTKISTVVGISEQSNKMSQIDDSSESDGSEIDETASDESDLDESDLAINVRNAGGWHLQHTFETKHDLEEFLEKEKC